MLRVKTTPKVVTQNSWKWPAWPVVTNYIPTDTLEIVCASSVYDKEQWSTVLHIKYHNPSRCLCVITLAFWMQYRNGTHNTFLNILCPQPKIINRSCINSLCYFVSKLNILYRMSERNGRYPLQSSFSNFQNSVTKLMQPRSLKHVATQAG